MIERRPESTMTSRRHREPASSLGEINRLLGIVTTPRRSAETHDDTPEDSFANSPGAAPSRPTVPATGTAGPYLIPGTLAAQPAETAYGWPRGATPGSIAKNPHGYVAVTRFGTARDTAHATLHESSAIALRLDVDSSATQGGRRRLSRVALDRSLTSSHESCMNNYNG